MSRLQKKCFIGATSMHVLLFVVLIVGPGFFSKDDAMDESDVLTFIPLMATDSGRQGGGTPQPPASNPTPTPPQPTAQPEKPAPEPPQPRVQEPVRQPDPPPSTEKTKKIEEKVEEKTPTRDNRDSLDPKSEKTKLHQVQVNTKVIKIPKNRPTTTTHSSDTDTTAQEQRDIARAAENAKLFANAGKSISKGLAPSTKIEMSDGPGGGGVSYAPYAQIVRKVYTDAWRIPDDVTDDEAVVKVSVTIARDGSVISSRIITESGSKLVDRSIQNALDRVTTIGVAFPAGAKESQRTFTISFSLKAKKLLG